MQYFENIYQKKCTVIYSFKIHVGIQWIFNTLNPSIVFFFPYPVYTLIFPLHLNIISHTTCYIFLIAIFTNKNNTFIKVYSNTFKIDFTRAQHNRSYGYILILIMKVFTYGSIKLNLNFPVNSLEIRHRYI